MLFSCFMTALTTGRGACPCVIIVSQEQVQRAGLLVYLSPSVICHFLAAHGTSTLSIGSLVLIIVTFS